MRLKLTESPAFQAIKEAGSQSTSPYKDAFATWDNLKLVLVALVAIMSAQGAAWYTLFFYAEQVFLERFMKIDPKTGTLLLMAITVASAPLYIAFAALSDRVGRKWVLWFGMTLALVAFFPGFHALARFANPALEQAQRRTPVVVVADPARCSLQFDLVGKAKFNTSCDLAKSTLSNAGISYKNHGAAAGMVAEVEDRGSDRPIARGHRPLARRAQGGGGGRQGAGRRSPGQGRLSAQGGSGAGELPRACSAC